MAYTSADNDDEILARYKLSEDAQKRVRRAFIKRDSLPKIVIVTEKLLIGFDAPVLYCMYPDKSMRDHTLLQPIARVPRFTISLGTDSRQHSAGAFLHPYP